MAFEITIPRLGWSMEEGTFVRWLKKEGDEVKPGDALFELEGEKAAQDIEAVDQGTLRIPTTSPKPGSVVAVGTVIGYLLTAGEPLPEPAAGSGSKPVPAKPDASAAVVPEPVKSEPAESPAAPPSVRRMARERGVDLSAVTGSGPAGRILAADLNSERRVAAISTPAAAPVNGQSSIASPRARRVATELGIDWRSLAGSGRDGRVRERDVRAAASRSHHAPGGEVVAVSSRRRTIANRMKASCDQTAPVTLTTRIDATNLVNLRNQFKAAGGKPVPSYSDIVMKLAALVLQQHPMLSVRSIGDQWVMTTDPADCHIGFAVDTDDGLVVPVVRQAGTLSLFELARNSATLIEKARNGKLPVAEMQGGVFTITNLGNFGIDAFTPIINLPETAVLGLGRIRAEATVVDHQIVARDQMTLSLTFDHRIVDGAPAARFLQSLSQAIENPSAWLLRAEG